LEGQRSLASELSKVLPTQSSYSRALKEGRKKKNQTKMYGPPERKKTTESSPKAALKREGAKKD
jgi:hypothetical protein